MKSRYKSREHPQAPEHTHTPTHTHLHTHRLFICKQGKQMIWLVTEKVALVNSKFTFVWNLQLHFEQGKGQGRSRRALAHLRGARPTPTSWLIVPAKAPQMEHERREREREIKDKCGKKQQAQVENFSANLLKHIVIIQMKLNVP